MKLLKHVFTFLGAMTFLLSPTLNAAIVDGAPGINKGFDTGVYVWRESSGNWQVRHVSSDGKWRQFSGDLQASSNISLLQKISLGGKDAAALSVDKRRLNFDMRLINKDILDGVKFGVATTADLCLYSDAKTTVYLGQNRVAKVTPVDLSGTGACGGQSGGAPTNPLPPADPLPLPPADTVAPPPQTAGGRKYNKGHYVGLLRKAGGNVQIRDALRPGMKGVMKRYTWKELEPNSGSYNLSGIQSDLNLVASLGLQLIVMIEDKTFVNENPMPGYLSSNQFVRKNRPGGYTAVRWNTTVVNRMKALMKAIGQRFDSNPNFEGVALQESAPGLPGVDLNATGYTAAKYRDALIAVLLDATKSMPTSRVFWFMNFMPQNQSYLNDVANAVKSSGVVLSGPDIQPDDHAIVKSVYPIIWNFKNKMPIAHQIEGSCYRHLHADKSYPTKYWTPAELFKYGRDSLGDDYMFWVRVTNANPADSYDWFDALPVIKNNPVF